MPSILDYFTGAVGSAESPQVGVVPVARLQIYTDGACVGNGSRRARAAYAVVIFKDGREVQAMAEPLRPTETHTNQRAELWAVLRAMEIAAASEEGADIHTDSKYTMDCLQEWAARWAAKGWRKADGDPVLNQDILRPMWEMWKCRGSKMRLFHVSAHTGRMDAHSRGNERADGLATGALRL